MFTGHHEGSAAITEVKQRWAGARLGWVTAWKFPKKIPKNGFFCENCFLKYYKNTVLFIGIMWCNLKHIGETGAIRYIFFPFAYSESCIHLKKKVGRFERLNLPLHNTVTDKTRKCTCFELCKICKMSTSITNSPKPGANRYQSRNNLKFVF